MQVAIQIFGGNFNVRVQFIYIEENCNATFNSL